MEASNDPPAPGKGQRMALTGTEYDRARGLVADRPPDLTAIGIDSNAKLPWDRPDKLGEVNYRASGFVDLATGARVKTNEELIEFLANPKAHSPETAGFGNRYVRYWLELRHRVDLIEKQLEKEERVADEREGRAEERAERAERRARLSAAIAIISVLIAAVALALKIFE